MKNKVVLVVDSGIGGLTTLKALSLYAPNKYVYFADYAFHPYGSKTPDDIRQNILIKIERLRQKFNIKGIVLACNTATAVAIKSVRYQVDIPVIGMEPALNLALREGKERILVLGTPITVRYSKVLNKAHNQQVVALSMPALASEIENSISNIESLYTQLRAQLSGYIGNVDGVVLGCTHYVYLKPLLRQIFSSDIAIYDGNSGVGKRAYELFGQCKKADILITTNLAEKRKNLALAWKICREDVCVE